MPGLSFIAHSVPFLCAYNIKLGVSIERGIITQDDIDMC